MGDDEVEKYNPAAAAIFKALGDENRWRILETLKEGERCACVLLTGCRSASPPSPTT